MTTDLSAFDLIIPCGIPRVEMTSIPRQRGESPAWEALTESVARTLREVFGLTAEHFAANALPLRLSAPVPQGGPA